MYDYRFSREVQLLLINHSDEKEEVKYNDNAQPFKLPKIGPRPPFYYNPRYQQYFPII